MFYYVIGGLNPSPHICSSLNEATRLAEELSVSAHDPWVTSQQGITITNQHLCPTEIFTEDEWKNAVRCD